MDHEIVWQLKKDNSYFLLDNWTSLGPLYDVAPREFPCEETKVCVYEVAEGGVWLEQCLRELLPKDFTEHMIQNVKPLTCPEQQDTPYWMLESRGTFSVRSAYHLVRYKKTPSDLYKHIWIKGIPFKISFLLWRLWKFKFPLDDMLKRWGIQFPYRCHCCVSPDVKTVSHLFLKAPVARYVWQYFGGPAGLNFEGLNLAQVINVWCDAPRSPILKLIYHVIPIFIAWELWKRRNVLSHGGSTSPHRVVYLVTQYIIMLLRVRWRNFWYAPSRWGYLLLVLRDHKPTLMMTKVSWSPPQVGWIKYNTDGASRGNSML